jgi:predicted Fe-Mo cluster-binding NifX family protein
LAGCNHANPLEFKENWRQPGSTLQPGTVVAKNLANESIQSVELTHIAMPTHPCIFCSKSYDPLSQTEPLRGISLTLPGLEFMRTAVPVFNGRVSPVLDTCTQLCVLEAGLKRGVNRTIPMKATSIFERASEIKKLGIRVIICGAVSEAFFNLLKEAGIDLIFGITGDIDEVIGAHRNGTLSHARFRMPGSK